MPLAPSGLVPSWQTALAPPNMQGRSALHRRAFLSISSVSGSGFNGNGTKVRITNAPLFMPSLAGGDERNAVSKRGEGFVATWRTDQEEGYSNEIFMLSFLNETASR